MLEGLPSPYSLYAPVSVFENRLFLPWRETQLDWRLRMKTDRWICTLVGTLQLELPNEFLSRKAGRESQPRENNLEIARSDGV